MLSYVPRRRARRTSTPVTMNIIRSLISLLVLSIVVLAGFGIVWWNDPPEKLVGYTGGGQAILAILMVLSLIGLVRLWLPPRERTA